jgi:DNA-binding transcriptional LysR family regulator
MIEAAHPPCDSARVPDWNDFRYFLAVARSGSLAGASRELGVEHTTVGRRLSALETELGARLFLRGPDGLVATEAGRGILPLAQEIETRFEAIERRVSGGDDRIEGTVRFSVSEAISGYFVKHFAALREQHPCLMVQISSGNHASDLMRGEADLAVRAREVTEPDLVARKVACAGWSLYAAMDYVARKGTPATPEDLRGHDVIGFDDSLRNTPGGLWLDAHDEGANVVMRGNSIVAAINAAICGMGIVAVPCFLAESEPLLRRLTPRVLGGRDIFLVVHPDLARVARVRAVMDFVVDMFARDAALWSGIATQAKPAAATPSPV